MNNLNKRLRPFVERARIIWGRRLAAVVLYGSRFWGYAGSRSDFDVFVLLKKKKDKDEKLLGFLKRDFPFVNIVYFRTLKETRQRIKDGSWAQYVVLQKASLSVYSTSEFENFLSWLKNFKINPSKIAEQYKTETNPFDIKALKKRTGGWDTNKWAALSIWKRLQILNYYQSGKLEVGFRENLEHVGRFLTQEEISWAKELYRCLW